MSETITMELVRKERRVFAIAEDTTHNIAKSNPDFEVYLVVKEVFGISQDVLVVRNKNTQEVVVEVEMGSEKKPPIVGGDD